MGTIKLREGEKGDEAEMESLESDFYQALKYAAPDLDFTVMPHLPRWDGMVAFRINKHPVGEDLNSVLGPRRLVDADTGEDIITVVADELEEVILDLRDLAAAREHAELDDAGLVDTAAMQGEGDESSAPTGA